MSPQLLTPKSPLKAGWPVTGEGEAQGGSGPRHPEATVGAVLGETEAS